LTVDITGLNMLREIKEQPQTTQDTIESSLRQAEPVRELIEEKLDKNHGTIFLIGSGTSHYASIAGKYALLASASIPSVAYSASDFRDFETKKKGDIVIAVSQSGETGDVLTAVEAASKNGCKVVSVTNEARSTLAKIADATIVTRAGREVAVPMTKTYTALLAALFSMAETLGRKKQANSPLMKISKAVEETIKTSQEKVGKMADETKEQKALFLLGRGPSYATALEACLKLKEAALVHAEAFSSPEFRHGPRALVEPRTSVIAFTNSHPFDETTVRLLEDLKVTGASTISIGDRGGSTITTPSLPNHLTPIIDIVPLQLLAAYVAVAKGINPDVPRSLVKTTTAI